MLTLFTAYVNAVLAVYAAFTFPSRIGDSCLVSHSINSRRSIAESTRDVGGFGTFGLTAAQQQLSQRVPARMDTFGAPAGQRDVIDVQWAIPPQSGLRMKDYGIESMRDGDVI